MQSNHKEHIRDRQAAGEDIYFVDQMLNPLNPAAHRDTTGVEIWEQTEGDLAAVVSAVGTGGTLRGISDYVKAQNKDVKIVAVEPALDATALTGIHNFTEVPEEQVPVTVRNTSGVYDEVLVATVKPSFEAARIVAKTDGVLVGNSSGAALWGATELAKRPEYEEKNIVVVFPDIGLRYLSTDLFNV